MIDRYSVLNGARFSVLQNVAVILKDAPFGRFAQWHNAFPLSGKMVSFTLHMLGSMHGTRSDSFYYSYKPQHTFSAHEKYEGAM